MKKACLKYFIILCFTNSFILLNSESSSYVYKKLIEINDKEEAIKKEELKKLHETLKKSDENLNKEKKRNKSLEIKIQDEEEKHLKAQAELEQQLKSCQDYCKICLFIGLLCFFPHNKLIYYLPAIGMDVFTEEENND